ncbi:MAG: endonuclease [Candidatus Phlomobacter fragariae]
MIIRQHWVIGILCLLSVLSTPAQAAKPVNTPKSFSEAKWVSRQAVYNDLNQGAGGTLYCGCDWQWTGKNGGRIDLESCGQAVRREVHRHRAQRIEWEHIVPASVFGQAFGCKEKGGRKGCRQEDPEFRKAEGDLHNLAPESGEVNNDRGNMPFGEAGPVPFVYGQCQSRPDFKQRVFEPRDEVKGLVSRVWFYMSDRYGFVIPLKQQAILMQWDRQYPPDARERERDRRITAITGVHNPFVTGEKAWEKH